MIKSKSYNRLDNGEYMVEVFENGNIVNSYKVNAEQIFQQHNPTELELLESNLLETQYQTTLIELLSGV